MRHGWYVVGCAFLVAVWGFGIGFYGPGLYLASLHVVHGWPIALLSLAVSVYYLCGAVGTTVIGDAIERFGARPVVTVGALAMALGVSTLALVQSLWQVYPAFIVMAAGWAAMNGAAVSTVVAPWFAERRGLALSLALNGGSFGGILITPLLAFLTDRLGFQHGLWLAAGGMLATLLPTVLVVLRRRPEEQPSSATVAETWTRRRALRDRAFLTIAIPFALAFVAQLGVLTHQISYLLPILGREGAALMVSVTTVAAVAGRTLTGAFVDRVDGRLVACATFGLQAGALAVLVSAESRSALYLGTALFGLGVGNTNTLPAVIVQQEFPRASFPRLVSLAVGINQFAFALGPAVFGVVRDWSGDYRLSFLLSGLIDVAAALGILLGRRLRSVASRQRSARSTEASRWC